jgi:cytochrome c-type biogenesis protein CcmH
LYCKFSRTVYAVGLLEARPMYARYILLLVILLSGFVLVHPLHAQSPEQELSTMEYDEKEAYAIDGMIMCPVCPAETIDQAQVPLARQMKQIIRQKLSDGQTREEILDYFVDRYGEQILAAPKREGFHLIAWVAPIFIIFGALSLGILALKSMKNAKEDVPLGSTIVDDQEDRHRYLGIVDQIVSQNHPSSSSSEDTINSEGEDGDRG